MKRKKHKTVSVEPSNGEPVIGRRVSGYLGLTEDILAGAVLVMVEGKHKVCIENYRSIIEYTEDLIRIQTKNCRLHIEGSKLAIAYFRDDEMCVVGNIDGIRYV